MEKKNCITVLLVQFIISGPGVFGEERYVRAGANETLSCPSRENVINVFWRYCDSCDNDLEASYILINSDIEISYPNINRIGFIFDTVNGVYSLILINFNGLTDAGKYFCVVDTGSTIFREYFEVEEAEGPTTALITGNSPVFADGSASQLTLTCTAIAIPAVTFEWRNRGTITGGSTSALTLSPVQASDDGTNITCTAMNSKYNDIRASHSVILTVHYDGTEVVCTATNTHHTDGQAKDNVILTVYYGPTSVSIEGNKPVYANGTNRLTLTCTATQYSPGVAFQWRDGNMNITGENKNIYTKIAVKSDNGKSITCLVWNSLYPNGKKETSIQLGVSYACKAVMLVSETNPSEGGDVTVVCTCDSNPAGTFTIKRPTGEQIHQSRLDIEDIFRTDTGEYVCTVGNVFGNQTKNIDILVNYAPEIMVTLPITTSTGDRGVQILCEADGIPNSYNFGKWRQLGPTDYKEIQKLHGAHSGNQSLLTFDKPLTYEDSGFYECNVNNGVFDKGGVLEQSVTKNLVIMGLPNILKNENTTYGKIGQDVKVEVSFYSVPQFTIVTWFLLSDSGQQNIVDISLDIQQTVEQRTVDTTFHGVSVNVNGFVATLLFKNMTVDNVGTYVAEISNDKGMASYTTKLEIKQNMMNTEENIDSPTIGVAAGSAAGASIIVVVIIVIVVVVLCKRGVITKPKSACLKGNESSTKNVYMNQAFSPVIGESGHVDETEYQEIGPSANPHMDYESLTSSDTPTETIINQ